MACSDLWAIHQKKCKKWQKGGFSSRLSSNEITTHGYRVLPFAKCTTIMIAVLRLQAVWDPLLTRWYGWEWDGFGLAYVELYDL
jgi:hypothetical protein